MDTDFWTEIVHQLDGRPFTWLARKAGIGQSALSRYFNGSRRLPSAVKARIEAALGITREQEAA